MHLNTPRVLGILLSAVMLLALSGAALAKDKPRIDIQVVNSRWSERLFSYTTPGTDTHSTTHCDSQATGIDLDGRTRSKGTTDCTTTTTPATPPEIHNSYTQQVHVHATMPDGKHVTLWCQRALRHCSSLNPGSYTAKVDGNSVWVYTHDLGGKEHKIKYHYVGGW